MADYAKVVRKWRDAHPGLAINDAALETMAPFPSLFANDFLAYVGSKEDYGREIVQFVRDMIREMVWTYSMWEKSQHDADLTKLFADMLNNCTHGSEYQFTNRFIRDYAKAHNIRLPHELQDIPAWLDIVPAGQVVTDAAALPPIDITPPAAANA